MLVTLAIIIVLVGVLIVALSRPFLSLSLVRRCTVRVVGGEGRKEGRRVVVFVLYHPIFAALPSDPRAPEFVR